MRQKNATAHLSKIAIKAFVEEHHQPSIYNVQGWYNASLLRGFVAMETPQYMHFVLISEPEDDMLTMRRLSTVRLRG